MKNFLLMAFLAVGLTANAEEMNENNVAGNTEKTVLAADNDKEINNGGLTLDEGKDDDRLSMHIYTGFNIPTDSPEGVDFSFWRSWEINWTIVQYDYRLKNSNLALSAGIGFNWRKYTLDGHKNQIYKDGNMVKIQPAGQEMNDLSSNIHTVSISVPLLAKYSFNKNFALSVGPQLNLNYYGRLHNAYKHGDDNHDISTKAIGQRLFTVDLMGIVHLWDVGIYCKYSPMSVIKKDRGPQFKSVAIGVYF